MSRAAWLVGVIMLMSIGPAFAGFQEGYHAFQKGDFDTAIRECLPLAEGGNSVAQFNLGFMYSQGHGVPQDYKEAVKWYRMAAEQGDAMAQYNLGISYASGRGVPQDYVQAHLWFNLSAIDGNSDSQSARDNVAKQMSPDQLAEAQRLAREWLEKQQQ